MVQNLKIKGFIKVLIIFILTIILFSCKEKDNTEEQAVSEKVDIIEPKIDLNKIETDFMYWWTYYSKNISLPSNFIGLNEDSDTIEKKQFIEKLSTGNYIPLMLNSKPKVGSYKLYELSSDANRSIRTTIKNESLTRLKHLKMEGKEFPQYDFTDLNGIRYTNENTIGKTLIIKTWFINCVACVAEFPELNEFVDKHKHDNNIIFLSLALDSKSELENFLQKKTFKYQVVPEQKEFISNLNLQTYPTHLVVDENGIITKVVNKASEMIAFFENEKELFENLPPPPAF